MSSFNYPTEYQIDKLEIDGHDITGIMLSLDIYENIYTPAIGGTITIMETTTAGFSEDPKFEIEFVEEIEFAFSNASDETLSFKGVINGLRNEVIKNQQKVYSIDFTCEEVRKNECSFVAKAFENKPPEEICRDMVKKLKGKVDEEYWIGEGENLTFTGNRKRANEVIKYCLTHGVDNGTQRPQATDNKVQPKETTKGTTGFLCWQTLNGYRFASINQLLEGKAGKEQKEWKTQLANSGLTMEESMKGVIEFNFSKIGDFQSQLRSGAFKNRVVSMDLDKGIYKEFTYVDDSNMTAKQKKAAGDCVTRYMNKPLNNERFENSPCKPAKPNTGDQSRKYMSQNAVRQNTFVDQSGVFTLPPSFTICAGDSFDVKIGKVEGEKPGGYDQKHSGKYVICKVGHHFINGQGAYTKIQTLRSTIQQNDASSAKVSSTGAQAIGAGA